MPAHRQPRPDASRPALRRRRLAVAGGITSAALALLAAVGGGAAAAATCQGASCNGLSPAATGCDQDAQLVAGDYIRVTADEQGSFGDEPRGTVHLWQSAACGTVWAVATRTYADPGEVVLIVSVVDSGDAAWVATQQTSLATTVTSGMWSPASSAPASPVFARAGFEASNMVLHDGFAHLPR